MPIQKLIVLFSSNLDTFTLFKVLKTPYFSQTVHFCSTSFHPLPETLCFSYMDLTFISLKATELAELTSKITLLEDAKKKKEDEARKWQRRVRV